MYFCIGFYDAFLDLLRGPLSHFKPFWDVFYRDFVPDKYPMSGPIQVAYILGFPTLGEPAGLAGWFQICPGNPQAGTGGTRPGHAKEQPFRTLYKNPLGKPS